MLRQLVASTPYQVQNVSQDPHLLQSGFRPGHSTTMTLLHVTNKWFRALDNGLFVGVVFLDITKAFDTVNHDLLLSCLWDFDLNSVTCQLS